jgi:aldose 1-epimerase
MQNIDFSHFKDNLITKSFGKLPDESEVFCYTLSNKNGIEMNVLNYGATIQSLKIPISSAHKVDVVLGFDSLNDYIQSFDLPSAPYLGAIVGRYAGRINNATFVLNGNEIQLTKNHNQHQLHGGNNGFSKAFWEVILLSSNSITLQYISDENEENFPGELTTQITYTLTEANELKVEMTATSTQDTIVNLTQHSYFNLDGHSETIENQEVCILSNSILEVTSENIPTGNFVSLNHHPFDFSSPKKCPLQIDNTFVIEKSTEAKAQLFSLKNKLKMSVYTNQPAIHVYVGGNCFSKIKGKENTDYHTTSGICFEAQNFPDAPNHAHFPNAILKKGDVYSHLTIFKFETY